MEEMFPIAESKVVADWPMVRPSVEKNFVAVGQNQPDTSRFAADRAVLKSGSRRAELLAIYLAHPDGLTDLEAVQISGVKHQSTTACRNGLMNDGWIEPAPDPDGPLILAANFRKDSWAYKTNGGRTLRRKTKIAIHPETGNRVIVYRATIEAKVIEI